MLTDRFSRRSQHISITICTSHRKKGKATLLKKKKKMHKYHPVDPRSHEQSAQQPQNPQNRPAEDTIAGTSSGQQWWKQEPHAPLRAEPPSNSRIADEDALLFPSSGTAGRGRPSTTFLPSQHSLVMQVTAHRGLGLAARRHGGTTNEDLDGRYPYHISPQRLHQQQQQAHGAPRFCDGGAVMHDAYTILNRSEAVGTGSANTSASHGQHRGGPKWYESPFDVAGAVRQQQGAAAPQPIRQVPIVGDTASLLAAIQIQVSMLMEQQNEAVRGALSTFQRDIQSAIGGIEQRVLAIEQQCNRMESVVLQDLQNARSERNMLAARLDAAKDEKDVTIRSRVAQLSTPMKGAGGVGAPPSDNSVFLQRLRQALTTNGTGGGGTPGPQVQQDKPNEGLLPSRGATPGAIPVVPSATSPAAGKPLVPPATSGGTSGLTAFLSTIVASSKEAAAAGSSASPSDAPQKQQQQPASAVAPANVAPAPLQQAAAVAAQTAPVVQAESTAQVVQPSATAGEQPARRQRAPAAQ